MIEYWKNNDFCILKEKMMPIQIKDQNAIIVHCLNKKVLLLFSISTKSFTAVSVSLQETLKELQISALPLENP